MLLLAEVTLAGLVFLSRSEASAQMLLSVRGDSSRPSSHASGLVLRAKGMSAVLAPHASNSRSAEALQAVLNLVVTQPSGAAMTTRISCATKLGPRIDLAISIDDIPMNVRTNARPCRSEFLNSGTDKFGPHPKGLRPNRWNLFALKIRRSIPLKLIAAPAGSYSARTISFASRLSSPGHDQLSELLMLYVCADIRRLDGMARSNSSEMRRLLISLSNWMRRV